MTLSDSDDVQTISSGSEDNKEREKTVPGKHMSTTNTMSYCTRFMTGFFFTLSSPVAAISGVTKKQVAVKSTRGIALKNSHSLMVKTGPSGGGVGPSVQGNKPGHQGQPGGGGENAPKNTRLFFDGEESCYIIDAKLEGNLGRYLNVSCSKCLCEHCVSLKSSLSSFTFTCPSVICVTAQLQS